MSDKSGMKSGFQDTERAVCRVAYTLNNSQPVVSTIIGDQPLFFMDFDIDEEIEYMDAAEIGLLESEIQTLKEQIQVSESFYYESTYRADVRFEEFLDNFGPVEKIDVVQFITETVAQSRLGKAYLDFAKEHCVEIIASSQVKDAFYDRNSGVICINPAMDPADMIVLSVRELRRHWYHRNGALIHPLMFDPDNAILVHRAHCADLSVAMIRVAWELQLSGYKHAWARLEDSSLEDLCKTFAREAYLDFRTINNGFASASVFEAWFLSDRCRYQDKGLIQTMLADHQGYVFELDQETGRSVTPNLIAALGSMPYGKNYLAEHALTIMNDPIFTDVRDRSNANFLWFIKFERSFKEAEQELHNVFDPAARGNSPGAIQFTKQDQRDGQAQFAPRTADVVQLYDAESAKDRNRSDKRLQSGKTKSGKNKQSADIIYLTCFSSDAQF